MPKFSINVSMMLQESPFLERFAVAAEAGFSGVDIQFPYDFTPRQITQAVSSANLEVVLFNLPVGDLVEGGRGLASEPGREKAYRDAVNQALPYVDALENKRINVLVGKADKLRDTQEHLDTLTENLEYTLSVFEPLGVTVMVEPVNGYDVPDYLLQSLEDTVKVINKVDADKIKIQFDIYHRHRVGEDVLSVLEQYFPYIAHIQFADAPGRHEPGTGEIDFADIFSKIDSLGYSDWVGAEYIPSKHTLETLSWYSKYK